MPFGSAKGLISDEPQITSRKAWRILAYFLALGSSASGCATLLYGKGFIGLTILTGLLSIHYAIYSRD